MTTQDLLRERGQLLARLEEIDKALELLRTPAKAVRIRTDRNIRNTYPFTTRLDGEGIMVWVDESLSAPADKADHEGFVSAADAARLRTEFGGVGLG